MYRSRCRAPFSPIPCTEMKDTPTPRERRSNSDLFSLRILSAFFEEIVGIRSSVGAVTHDRGIVYPRDKNSSSFHEEEGGSISIEYEPLLNSRRIELTIEGSERSAVVSNIWLRMVGL